MTDGVGRSGEEIEASYDKALETIEAALGEYFGAYSLKYVLIGTGMDENGELYQRMFIPDSQVASDSLGLVEYAKTIVTHSILANYVSQMLGLDPNGADD